MIYYILVVLCIWLHRNEILFKDQHISKIGTIRHRDDLLHEWSKANSFKNGLSKPNQGPINANYQKILNKPYSIKSETCQQHQGTHEGIFIIIGYMEEQKERGKVWNIEIRKSSTSSSRRQIETTKVAKGSVDITSLQDSLLHTILTGLCMPCCSHVHNVYFVTDLVATQTFTRSGGAFCNKEEWEKTMEEDFRSICNI